MSPEDYQECVNLNTETGPLAECEKKCLKKDGRPDDYYNNRCKQKNCSDKCVKDLVLAKRDRTLGAADCCTECIMNKLNYNCSYTSGEYLDAFKICKKEKFCKINTNFTLSKEKHPILFGSKLLKNIKNCEDLGDYTLREGKGSSSEKILDLIFDKDNMNNDYGIHNDLASYFKKKGIKPNPNNKTKIYKEYFDLCQQCYEPAVFEDDLNDYYKKIRLCREL